MSELVCECVRMCIRACVYACMRDWVDGLVGWWVYGRAILSEILSPISEVLGKLAVDLNKREGVFR